MNADLQPEGSLARSWNVVNGGQTYQFELRRGLQFHDGRTLTAEDVKWSWERALHPATRSRTARVTLGNIEGAHAVVAGDADDLRGVEIVSDHELEVNLVQPASFFPTLVAQGASLVVDRASVEHIAAAHWWDRRSGRPPVNGSGPYRLTSLEPRSGVVLERNASFVPRQSGPNIVRIAELDPAEALLRYEENQLDIIGVGGADIDRFSDTREPRASQLRSRRDLATTYLGFNTLRPPFDDHHARRAFAYAVDRERINRVTFRGHHNEARGILPPGLLGHQPDYAGLSFDMHAVQRELARSRHGPIGGWPDLTLATAGYGLLPDRTTRAIVEPWRDHFPTQISVHQFDFIDFLDVLENLDNQSLPSHMYITSWVADFPDPFGFLDVLFGSDRPDNHGGFKNHLVDALLATARSESDPNRRAQAYGLVESRIIELGAVIPISHGVSHELVQPWVREYPGRSVVREWLTDVEVAFP